MLSVSCTNGVLNEPLPVARYFSKPVSNYDSIPFTIREKISDERFRPEKFETARLFFESSKVSELREGGIGNNLFELDQAIVAIEIGMAYSADLLVWRKAGNSIVWVPVGSEYDLKVGKDSFKRTAGILTSVDDLN